MLCWKFFNRDRGNELHALYVGKVERQYWPGLRVRQRLRRRDSQRQRRHSVRCMCGGVIYQWERVRRLRSWILLLSRYMRTMSTRNGQHELAVRVQQQRVCAVRRHAIPRKRGGGRVPEGAAGLCHDWRQCGNVPNRYIAGKRRLRMHTMFSRHLGVAPWAVSMHPMPPRHVWDGQRVRTVSAAHHVRRCSGNSMQDMRARVRSRRYELRPMPPEPLPCYGRGLPSLRRQHDIAGRQHRLYTVSRMDDVARLRRVSARAVHGRVR